MQLTSLEVINEAQIAQDCLEKNLGANVLRFVNFFLYDKQEESAVIL